MSAHPPFYLYCLKSNRYGLVNWITYVNNFGVPDLGDLKVAKDHAAMLGWRVLFRVKVTPKARA